MSTVNNGPQIVRSGLVLNLDASSVTSYSAIAVYKVECYSTFGGGLRSANYTVQYSDDNSTWTTAFTGVMSNNSSCGIITGTNRNDSNYSKHRYWRYVEGGAVVGHHPRVSRIDFITKSGAIYNLTTYTTDNCADSGTYIVGTVTKDFGGTTWRDISGNNRTGTLTNGPLFNTSNYGNILFDGTNDYVIIPSGGSYSEYTFMFFCKWITDTAASSRLFGCDAFGTYTVFNPSNVGFHYNQSAGSSTTISSGVNVGLGTWCHVAVTVSTLSSIAYIYINGSLTNGSSSIPYINLSGNLFLGAQNTGAGVLANCNIALFQFYNRVLSATEISQNFQADKTRFGL
jgi:hypothetical protein